MRRIKYKFNKAVRKSIIGVSVIAIVSYAAAMISGYLMMSLVIFGILVLSVWLTRKSNRNFKKYINENGYVVLIDENDLEHRVIAKNILNRHLKANEVIHHINGKKTDNSVSNLCLMDREKHELFHTWLSWKRSKSGKYPSYKEQKRILEREYCGVLLSQVAFQKRYIKQARIDAVKSDIQTQRPQPYLKPRYDAESLRILFEELRAERLRIARLENIPAYMVFYDKNLYRMTQIMPDSDHQMLKAIGPSKYQRYGPEFLAVIQRFKMNHMNGKYRDTGTN